MLFHIAERAQEILKGNWNFNENLLIIKVEEYIEMI